jgi:acyl dehydratase
MVLETAIKWLIPMICVAIVGLVTAHFIKPFKAGNEAARQAEWDLRFAASTKPKEMGNTVRGELESTVAKTDSKIIEKLDNLTTSIDQSNKDMAAYHAKVDASIKLIQEGVQDAHL